MSLCTAKRSTSESSAAKSPLTMRARIPTPDRRLTQIVCRARGEPLCFAPAPNRAVSDRSFSRRLAREAEGAPLLREYGVKSSIEGSNPSVSASSTGETRVPQDVQCTPENASTWLLPCDARSRGFRQPQDTFGGFAEPEDLRHCGE